MYYEIENLLELQNEIYIWTMEEAFAEANTQYLNDCESVVIAAFGGVL